MKDLKGKKALVTGGAMGIGLATCKRLLRAGCEVTVWDMNAKALEDAKRELSYLGKVYAYTCDVTDKPRVLELCKQAEQDMGQVDILINNAGFVRAGRFCNHPVEEWERETAVNLTSMYYTIHALLPGMYRRNLGHIVNISSSAGLMGVADLAVYCATKWGVFGLTESLRFEALADKKSGIKYTSVHPIFLKTGMFEGGSLNILGNLLIPSIETHDEVAEAIVEKGLKKDHHVIKLPMTLQLIFIARALLPDSLMGLVARLMGIGNSMSHWVGRPGSEHAQR
jgi:all-trans-retinol dehydrogenase (NAD+)